MKKFILLFNLLLLYNCRGNPICLTISNQDLDNNLDNENFDDKPYILMEQETSAGLFSLNEDDFKQYTYKTVDEKINYTSNDGTTVFTNFRTFAIKVVFTRDLDVQTTFIGIPKISDLKSIALDSVGNP